MAEISAAASSVAQQPQTVRRQHGLGMKLHPHPGTVIIAQRHDFAFRAAGRHRQQRIGVGILGAHNQRMIAAHAHGIGQAGKQARAVMHNVGLLAVHDAGPDLHHGPGMQAQQLMPEADAEDGHARIKALQELGAQARGRGMSRTGRQADHFQLAAFGQFQHGGIVILEHHRFPAQLIESLHKVVGKGIVIIYEQKHGAGPPLPAQGA